MVVSAAYAPAALDVEPDVVVRNAVVDTRKPFVPRPAAAVVDIGTAFGADVVAPAGIQRVVYAETYMG